jgi:hypothetical protein
MKYCSVSQLLPRSQLPYSNATARTNQGEQGEFFILPENLKGRGTAYSVLQSP